MLPSISCQISAEWFGNDVGYVVVLDGLGSIQGRVSGRLLKILPAVADRWRSQRRTFQVLVLDDGTSPEDTLAGLSAGNQLLAEAAPTQGAGEYTGPVPVIEHSARGCLSKKLDAGRADCPRPESMPKRPGSIGGSDLTRRLSPLDPTQIRNRVRRRRRSRLRHAHMRRSEPTAWQPTSRFPIASVRLAARKRAGVAPANSGRQPCSTDRRNPLLACTRPQIPRTRLFSLVLCKQEVGGSSPPSSTSLVAMGRSATRPPCRPASSRKCSDEVSPRSRGCSRSS